MNNINKPVLIVANGEFPSHSIPINILNKSKFIIACDGATNKLYDLGFEPNLIIGDLDSINRTVVKKFKQKIIYIKNQEENDLRKALQFCKSNNLLNINIIGATGKREDHTIGNIFSLNSFKDLNIKLFTNFGCFVNINKPTIFKSFKNQQISIFTENKNLKIDTFGLKYNFKSSPISCLYSGTLNECIGSEFFIKITNGELMVYLKYN